jgi:hypothetical protein
MKELNNENTDVLHNKPSPSGSPGISVEPVESLRPDLRSPDVKSLDLKSLESLDLKSLEEKRQELCQLLQTNRRLIARKLVGEERHNQFPRSAVMRFVSNHSTREILHKAANAALGLQTYRAARWGLSALNLIRKGFRKI